MYQKRILVSALNVLGIATMLQLCSCENNIDTVNLITAKDNTLLQSEVNATYVYTDSSKTKFKLTAPLMNNYGGKEDPHQDCPKGINVDFYDDSMHVTSHINANYAIRHVKTNIFEADGNVVVVNKKGERLTSEQLFWDGAKHSIYTQKFVTIKTATEILYGDGLQSNEDFTDYRITNIRGTVMLNNPQ
ncbi:MAG TPA: LPS export ABC transporter periplasmic protein LptC [Bacteroidia bacterium]|jgi:LPS export ABC transporter protein LptC|nr:LPS export ABC transporter periplasmic protein LptC [Bacteroidia bacterium]